MVYKKEIEVQKETSATLDESKIRWWMPEEQLSYSERFFKKLSKLPDKDRKKILKKLSQFEQHELVTQWKYIARPQQLPPPGDWDKWLLLAGRGWGKTRLASEWMAEETSKDKNAGVYGLFGRSLQDIKRNQILGESGLLETYKRKGIKVVFDRKEQTITLLNGVKIYSFSSDTPDAVRGQNLSAGWFDELASYYNLEDTWTQACLAIRRGSSKKLITTTPKITAARVLVKIMMDSDTYVTRGTTFENSKNLTKSFMKDIRKIAATRIGQQEIYAKILDDSGVLFKESWIQKEFILPENCDRIVVSVDPAMSNTEASNEHGIVVAGKNGERGFVFEDLSASGSANHAATVAIEAFYKYKADYIVIEKNQGGMWLESVFKSLAPNIPLKMVTATRGKITRAEPVASLYEQKRISHIGEFTKLEFQMRTFDPETPYYKNGKTSPDRLDALVWAFTYLFNNDEGFIPFGISSPVGMF